jgi:hypothetical protein
MPPAAFRACGAIETTVARQVLSALVGGGVGGSGGAGGELMILLSRIAEQDRKLEEQAAAHARLEASLASTCSTSVPPSLVWIIQGCRQLEARVVALEQQERQVGRCGSSSRSGSSRSGWSGWSGRSGTWRWRRGLRRWRSVSRQVSRRSWRWRPL